MMMTSGEKVKYNGSIDCFRQVLLGNYLRMTWELPKNEMVMIWKGPKNDMGMIWEGPKNDMGMIYAHTCKIQIDLDLIVYFSL